MWIRAFVKRCFTNARKTGHGMAQVVARMSKCRAAKFSGVIFERQNVTSECPDGLPKAMRALRYSSGFELVGVPPALVATAARRISLKNISAPTLCAVFERYGCDDEDARGKDVVQWREDDIAMQMEAWSDVRSVLRTETDLLRPEGVELFHESLADMLD